MASTFLLYIRYNSVNPKTDSEYVEALETFEKEMDPEGPFFFGIELGWVDILIAPCKHTS